MLNIIYSNIFNNCDAPRPWGLYFQDSATPQMEGLVELHNNIMFYLVIILFGVGWIMISIVRNYNNVKSPGELLGKWLLWVNKLPNFGELLKLLVPSYSWKAISGWSNYSGTVTSQEICENKMDNRESKSVICESIAVKEQRVDGSCTGAKPPVLRCTLMGFERNLPINIQSKLINKKFFSTSSLVFFHILPTIPRGDSGKIEKKLSPQHSWGTGTAYFFLVNNQKKIRSASTIDKDHDDFMPKMNPWFFTGFSDGEASFMIYIQKTNSTKIGWASWVSFEINLSDKDLSILKSIKSYLKVGTVNQKSDGSCVYYIRRLPEISILIDHFEKYPLLTQKFADYLLFKSAYDILKKKEHLTIEGLHKLLAIKAVTNKGLPEVLKETFPNITSIERPRVFDSKIPDPNWLAGFSTAEGSFMVSVMDNSNSRSQVLLRFKLTQHSRDEQLMRSLVNYLDCGKIYVNERSVDFIVTKFSDITNKLIPLFGKYPIQGIKNLNYLDFLKVWQLMINDLHLTDKGVKLIRKIKAGMNLGRK